MEHSKHWKVKTIGTSISIYTVDDELVESFNMPKKEKAKKSMIRNIENEVLDHNYRLERKLKMRSPEYAKRQSELRRTLISILARQ